MVFPNLKCVASGLGKTFGVIAISAALLVQSTALSAAAEKYAAFVIDANNGKVLFSKYADEPRYPASLTKMMTLYMLFEAIENGRTSLTTKMKVSPYAAARPPSKLGMKPGSTITVEEAILSLVTKSANDAAVVIGEHLAGTEARFAESMTAKARQIGMSRTVFRNANGLPNTAQKTTARDMATLGIALRQHFPKEYAYFKTRAFNFRGRKIGNHNRLLGRIQGVDGIKTGYINASGFNLVSSVATGNKKLVGVVMGGNSGASRDNHMAELLNKYLPQASGRAGDALIAKAGGREDRIASAEPARAAASDQYTPPSRVPIPAFSNRVSVNERIAAAYGSDAGGAIARIAGPAERPVVGRAALRSALSQSRPDGGMDIPAASSLAPMRSAPSRLIPPGAIPDVADFDPGTTGSVAAVPASVMPRSPWVIQIAAAPSQAQALKLLGDAKATAGSALDGAEPFTQTVASGSQTLHRARFAGFQSKSEANKACAVLKKRSYSCLALAN